MKRIFTIALLAAVSFCSHGQGLFDKMKKFAGDADSLGAMKNGNSYVIDGNGTITLPDNSVHEGTIKYVITDDMRDLTFVWFTPASEMKPQKMKSDEILAFTVKNKTFIPIRTKEDDLNIGNKTIFMEMLNNSTADKMQMFRLRKLEKNTSGIGQNAYDLKRGFYVKLPELKNAHDITDLTFSPFAKKMSEYLKDCPDLAKKIADKETGYKVNMFNGAANNEIFIRVMQEYNACGK